MANPSDTLEVSGGFKAILLKCWTNYVYQIVENISEDDWQILNLRYLLLVGKIVSIGLKKVGIISRKIGI